MSYKSLLLLIFIVNSFCFTQETQKSPYSGHYMYYFYSKTDDLNLKKQCDDLGVKQAGMYLLLGQDTVRFTQGNDSLKVFRVVKDAIYLGRGIEDTWTSRGVNTYIKFREFIKP
ncbi:MAG: hypothetical protein KBG21_02695 [Ignavibacteria bacterium]|nr:hypothetical protein [Ignavibacteria bacterium]